MDYLFVSQLLISTEYLQHFQTWAVLTVSYVSLIPRHSHTNQKFSFPSKVQGPRFLDFATFDATLFPLISKPTSLFIQGFRYKFASPPCYTSSWKYSSNIKEHLNGQTKVHMYKQIPLIDSMLWTLTVW